jgi:DNA mismatch endonuclease (patch repair protein)
MEACSQEIDRCLVARRIGESYPHRVMGGRRPQFETDDMCSARMARVRQRGTKPELAVRSLLSELGARYRLNTRNLPGSPDISNKAARKAIFVHGCFWHRHAGCHRATMPKRNRALWLEKFERTQQRDVDKSAALERLGFNVLVVWECEVKDAERLRARLVQFWRGRDGQP